MRLKHYRPLGKSAAKGFFFPLLFLMMAACNQPTPVPSITTPMPALTSTPPPTVAMDPTIASVIAATTLTTQVGSLAETATATVTATACTPPEGWVVYSVRPLDTLFSLAQRTNSLVTAIKDANCLLDDLIFVDDILFLPVLPPAPPPASAGSIISVADATVTPETACSLLECPLQELAELDWPIGGPNLDFEPCQESKPAPWISFETEGIRLADGTLDPTRYDRELGQRSYYFICDFPDPTRMMTAQLSWAGGMKELMVITAVADPTRKMGHAQGVIVWNAICDDLQSFPVDTTYTLTVADNQQQKAELIFQLKPPGLERILTVPAAATPGTVFDFYYCGYNNLSNREIQVDFYYEISYEPVGTFYHIGHSQSRTVRINEKGQGMSTLATFPNDPPRAYFVFENQFRGWDQIWLIP